VVDMFYFPVWHGNYPSWFPRETDVVQHINENVPNWVPRANEPFTFFSPVFNIADAAISVGVFFLIVFSRRLFGKQNLRSKSEARFPQLSERRIFATNIFFGLVTF